MSEPKLKVVDKVTPKYQTGIIETYEVTGFDKTDSSYGIIDKDGHKFVAFEDSIEFSDTSPVNETLRTASETEKVTNYDSIVTKLKSMYESKNAAYGDSFALTYQKYGITALLIQLTHKMNRLDTLTRKPDISPADESVKDTLYDLANYAIMGLAEIEKEKK